jgi:hypothetical protein
MFCTNCGSKIAEGAVFCTGCGGAIKPNGSGEKPIGIFSLIIKIIIMIALAGLLFYLLFWDFKTNSNMFKSDADPITKYSFIFASIISIIAQLSLILILIRRWSMVSVIKKIIKRS